MWIPRVLVWICMVAQLLGSSDDLLKIQLLTTVQCSLYRCRCGPVKYHFSTFYSTSPLCSLSTSVCICLCLHLCITIIYLSFSLEVSLWVFISVLFSLIFHLTHPSFSSLWIFLIYSLSPGFFFQLLLFQLGEWYTVLYSFISDKQCDHSQLSNLLHF